jgi:phospholipase/carboxylesterase
MTSAAGPRLPPRSGPAKQLVLILHGYGADGHDLIELARHWQPLLPQAAFFAPHAPEACMAGGPGRQWFPLTFRDPHERWRGVNHAAPSLHALIDAELAALGLDDSRLALVGFSQGCMMALHVGLRRARPPAALLGYSGMLVLPEGSRPESLKDEVRSVPPILLIHGDLDDVIPVEALFASAGAIAAGGLACEWHLSAGIGHGIDPEGLRHGGLFLASSLGLPGPRP